MTRTEALRRVVALACLTEDRDRAEQAALERLAREADRFTNRQTVNNRDLAGSMRRYGWRPPPCTYSKNHTKTCACRGDGRAYEPDCGWSRLEELARATKVAKP